MLTGGGDIDPVNANWFDECGHSIQFSDLHNFQVIFLQALRDIEGDLKNRRLSPLAQIIESMGLSNVEQNELLEIVNKANQTVSKKETISQIGKHIAASYQETAGDIHALEVKLGLQEMSFSALSANLSLLLSSSSLKDFGPGRNGLGLNNILYISMLMESFRRRMEKNNKAGQLLILEEPEAHLHPQLQRVLYDTLSGQNAQCVLTTHSTHICSHAPLNSYFVLNSNINSTGCSSNLTDIDSITPGDISDLERFLDVTRSTLLFAKKVILVEGPSELFLIPALFKNILGIDLDRLGISIISIHGKHFSSYAKLFCQNGLSRKCAIITDGDKTFSSLDEDVDDEDSVEYSIDTSAFDQQYVRVFECETTFEREITTEHTLPMFIETCNELNLPRVKDKLSKGLEQVKEITHPNQKKAALKTLGDTVLRSAKRVGKARFAQVASKHANLATKVPHYIHEAISWIQSQ